jgi:hypothetical protein
MATNYYYLVAGLPMLALGRPPSIASAGFRQACREQLAPDDFEVLADLLDAGGRRTSHPFARAWRERDTRLRNAVARARAGRLNREAGPHLRPAEGFDTYTERAVAEAFARATPAERELDLDRFRWSVLDELAGFNPFALAGVLAYGLKLRLAERWSGLEAARGRAAVERAVAEQATGNDDKREVRRV